MMKMTAVIEVTKCEDCPMYSVWGIDDNDYCSAGGHPEGRYPMDHKTPDQLIPNECPLLQGTIEVKLNK